MKNKLLAAIPSLRTRTGPLLQRLATSLRWGCGAAAIAMLVAGCGGGNDRTLTADAQAQRDRTAAVTQAQQSVTALMSAVVQPGSGVENFEAGMGDWQNWGNAQVVANAGTAGSMGLAIGPGPGGAALQVPGIVGGTTYRLTANLRVTELANGPLTMGLDFYDASGARILGTQAPNITSTASTLVTHQVEAPANTAFALVWFWKNGDTGFGAVDDVAFGPASGPSPPPPPPPAANLLSNGGFEAGMTDWVDWGNTRVVNDNANSGTSALSVGTSAGGAGHYVDGIVPGTNYRMGVSAKVSDASETVFVGVNFVDAAGSIVGSTQRSTSSTSYTPISADTIAPTGAARAVVYAWKNGGSGLAFVDDFSFGVAPGAAPPASPPPSGNLLVNGGFEGGSANWVDWGNFVLSGQAAGGSAAAQVGTGAGGFGQNVAGIVPGATYRLNAQAKVSSADEIAYLGLKFVDAAGHPLQDTLAPFNATSYATAQVELIAPPNASGALVYVWKNAGSGLAFVDEVALTAVAGPGSSPPPTGSVQPGELLPFASKPLSPEIGGGRPATARLAGGGAVVAWSGRTSGLVQRLDATGGFVGPAQVVGPTGSLAATSDGGWVIAWVTQGNVAFQRYDAAGTPTGAPGLADSSTAGQVHNVRVTGLADGGFIVAWVADGASTTRAYLRRFDASGTAVTGRMEPTIAPENLGEQTELQVAPLPNGRFHVAWVQATPEGLFFNVKVRQLDGNLNRIGEEHVLGGIARESVPGAIPRPPIKELTSASLSNGSVLFAWAYSLLSTQSEVRWQVLQPLAPPPPPSAAGRALFGGHSVNSVEAVPSADGGFRVVTESTRGFPRLVDGFTTVFDVGSQGELLGTTELDSRTLLSVSSTGPEGCFGNINAGVAASGGEDGRYLVAATSCSSTGGMVLVQAR